MTRRLCLVVLVFALFALFALGTLGTAAAGASPGTPWLKERPFDDVLRPPRLVPAVHFAQPPSLGARAARYARRLIGVPYRYGGDSPGGGFDCSGLVRYVFGRFGVDLPHSSYADFGLGRYVGRAALRPGDLVFFDGVGHVGMYVGAGSFIHAPHSGTTVRISSMSDPWYSSRYDGARRVVRR